jgi:RNA polymerase-binding transcription factor DksA
MAFSTDQMERLRARLLAERAAAEARIREREGEIPGTARPDEDLADRGDDATTLFERERLMLDNELDGALVEKIDHALQRMREGAYGISEVSGEQIPLERLEAVPWATMLADEEPPASE